MVREFKFFRGYVDDLSININWTPGYGTITIPNYPNYFIGDYPLTGTITTTPYIGTYTIYNGTINAATGFSLTTSNPNGITYTTSGMGGTLTTGTATYTNSASTTNIK